jgi:hypothetical protein
LIVRDGDALLRRQDRGVAAGRLMHFSSTSGRNSLISVLHRTPIAFFVGL